MNLRAWGLILGLMSLMGVANAQVKAITVRASGVL
jgi:hypothetical protein